MHSRARRTISRNWRQLYKLATLPSLMGYDTKDLLAGGFLIAVSTASCIHAHAAPYSGVDRFPLKYF
jgi:hypothetical protein